MFDKIWVPDKKILAAKSTKVLEKLLTDLYSQYIRRKDADPVSGITECFTCRGRFYWKDMDCGHFVKRANMCTKFNEKNNHPQCRHCNRRLDGKSEEYRKRLDAVYGEGTAEALILEGHKTCKFMRNDIMEMIQDTKAKLDKLS